MSLPALRPGYSRMLGPAVPDEMSEGPSAYDVDETEEEEEPPHEVEEEDKLPTAPTAAVVAACAAVAAAVIGEASALPVAAAAAPIAPAAPQPRALATLVGPIDFGFGQLSLEQHPALPLPRLCLRFVRKAIDASSIDRMLAAVDAALLHGEPFTSFFDVRCANLPSRAHLKQISEWNQTRSDKLRKLSHGFAIVLSAMMTRSAVSMILAMGKPSQPHAVFTKEEDAFAFARDKCLVPPPCPADRPPTRPILRATRQRTRRAHLTRHRPRSRQRTRRTTCHSYGRAAAAAAALMVTACRMVAAAAPFDGGAPFHGRR